MADIEQSTGAPPAPPAPTAAPAAAPAATAAPAAAPAATAAPAAPTNTPTPTEQREATIAAAVMPKGVVPPTDTKTAPGTEVAAEMPKMPSGVITEPDANWQVAAEGSPDEYTKFTLNMGLDDNGVPTREEFAPKEGENMVYDKFVTDAKLRGLSQTQAQEELDRIAEYVEASRAQQEKKGIEQANEWAKELSQWGFAKNPEVMRNVGAALKRYDPNGRVRDLLERSGASNVPEVAHMLSELGRRITEGGPVAETHVMTPNAGPKPIGGTQPTKSRNELMEALVNANLTGSRNASITN